MIELLSILGISTEGDDLCGMMHGTGEILSLSVIVDHLHRHPHTTALSQTLSDRPTAQILVVVLAQTDPSDTFFFFFNDSLSLLLMYTPRIFTDPLASSLAPGQFNYRPILIQFEGRFSTELHRSRTTLALIPVCQVTGAI